jgi:diguanylate cyclase (GGDEF)-like protein/PAS domain S-box-containing protein
MSSIRGTIARFRTSRHHVHRRLRVVDFTHQSYVSNASVLPMKISPSSILQQIYGTVSDFGIMTLGPDGRVTSWSAGAAALFGYAAEEIMFQPSARLFTLEDIAKNEPQKEIDTADRYSRAADYRWHLRKDGSRFWADGVLSPIRNSDHELIGYLKILRDITKRKLTEDEISRMATLDMLTGLANRTSFDRRCKEMIALATRTRQVLLLLLIDLDRFKDVNDTLGHHAGDLVLRETGARIRQVSRESDLAARLGGDEFALLVLNPPTASSGGMLAEKLLGAFEKPFIIEGCEARINASIGIAVCPSDATTSDDLMQKADLALYRSKGDGRNCYRYFTKDLDESAHRRTRERLALRQIEKAKAFILEFQPIIDYQSGRTIAMEALIRFPETTLASYPVDYVIELAKEIGLIVSIGSWVFREACSSLSAWKKAGVDDVKMAINTCAHELLHPEYLQQIDAAVNEFHLSAPDIEIELTEREGIEVERNDNNILHALRARGFALTLDDFGTGYSSLSYLRSLPVTALKLDKSFLRDVPGVDDANAVTRTVIALARDLRLAVTAEGVENRDQADFLLDANCTTFQGFLFSTPLNAGKALAWLLADKQNANARRCRPHVRH